MSNATIKQLFCGTEPMQFIVAKEARTMQMMNWPVLYKYKDKRATELAERES